MITANDLEMQLMSTFGEYASGNWSRAARMAIRLGITRLGNEFGWSYYRRPLQIYLEAPYATGTVTYTHTGGTAERQVELTGGTWPDWAANGVLVVGSVGYQVSERISDTIIVLNQNSSNDNISISADSYTLYRPFAPLPSNLIRMSHPVLSNQTGVLKYMSPEALFVHWSREQTNTGTPYFYTIMGDPNGEQQFSMYVYPFPDAAYTCSALAELRPREVQTYKLSTGTVSVSGNVATFSGLGVSLTDKYIGASLRISGNAVKEPTALEGENPYEFEGVITAVPSATTARVNGSPGTLTTRKFVISDILDIDSGTMLSSLVAACTAEMARLQKKADVERYERLYQSALRESKHADARRRKNTSAMKSGIYALPLSDHPIGDDVT